MGRPAAAGNAPGNTIMGKVKQSPYSGTSLAPTSTPAKASNLPVLIAVALVGALAIMWVRQRSNPAVQTGPLVVLTQSAAPDQSTIDNLTNSINALAGQVHTASPVPTGGASTPITTTGA